MKYYIIAGEASGDLHGANLIKSIKEKDPDAEFRVWGGDRMEKEGAVLVKHYRDLAFMGFLEVILNLRTIFKNIAFCKEDIKNYQPDGVILIDYPGFNLRIAPFVKSLGIKVIYYISPQIWAWKQSRVHQIKKVVDRMLVILPFEKEFYSRFGMEVDFVGHPLLDEFSLEEKESELLRSFHEEFGTAENKPIVALLPGSRKQEIKSMLPVMLKAAEGLKEVQVIIAGAPGIEEEFYKSFFHRNNVHLVKGQTYRLLKISHAAMVTSGTATLETAFFDVPQVVCYKGNWISYAIARKLVKVKYISLVNLIMDRVVVRELIQKEMNAPTLQKEIEKLVSDQYYRKKIKEDYEALRTLMGGKGASEVTANLVLKTLKKDA